MSVELVIRGGTVVDGTGAPPVRADVAVAGGRIVAVGEGLRGDAELDAGGLLVTPGFVDIHTHYDPQVLWDPALTPSSFHGVTSVVAGNCGYSLAPTRAADRPSLLRTLDKVEDMRIGTLEAGVPWEFETYPEYLDAVRRRGVTINFGGYVGHTAVRLYVLGDDAYERPATPEEVDRMRAVVADSLRGGALGFSSDRAGFHLGDGGRPVPSMVATQEETEALMAVTAELGLGVVHVAPGERFHWIYDFQRRLGRRVNWSALLTYPPAATSRAPYRDKLAHHLAGRAGGADVWVQVTCRPIVQEISLREPTPFYSQMPSLAELVPVPDAERHHRFRDPAWRARVWREFEEGGLMGSRWGSFVVTDSAAHPELVGRSAASLAAERGGTPFDAVCEVALADDLATRFSVTFANDDEEGIALLVASEGCIMGLSDAGADVSQICDAVMPTDFLAHWVRDRGVMPLEAGIRKLTGEIAEVVGLADGRGVLRPGAPADVVVLDWDALDPGPVRRIADLPAGGDRLLADAPRGVEHVLVNGEPVRRHGIPVAPAPRPGVVLAPRGDDPANPAR